MQLGVVWNKLGHMHETNMSLWLIYWWSVCCFSRPFINNGIFFANVKSRCWHLSATILPWLWLKMLDQVVQNPLFFGQFAQRCTVHLYDKTGPNIVWILTVHLYDILLWEALTYKCSAFFVDVLKISGRCTKEYQMLYYRISSV